MDNYDYESPFNSKSSTRGNANSSISYFIYIHKNLIPVSYFSSDIKERYGCRIVVLEKGRVKVCTTKSLKEVSLAYYNSKFRVYFHGETLFGDLRQTVMNSANAADNISRITDHLLSASDSIAAHLPTFDTAKLIFDILQLISFSRALLFSSTSIFTLIDLFNWLVSAGNVVLDLAYMHYISEEETVPQAIQTAYKKIKNFFFGESLNAIEATLGVVALEKLLPAPLRKIFQSAPLYTKTKLLDDSNIMQDCITWICDVPIKLARLFYLPEKIQIFIEDTFSSLPFSRVSKYKSELEKLIAETLDDVKMSDKVFQNRFCTTFESILEWKNEFLMDHSRLPFGFSDIFVRAERIYDKIQYAKNVTRQEPVLIVFYGRPGCGKSVLLAKFLEAVSKNNTIYMHNPKEKDFYDNYDSQDIMGIDDVGQKGVWQWSELIPMVSSNQYVLDCAQAHNKDKKRFVSKVIACTTNKVDLILTKNDGIDDPEALYRRIHKFDFSDIRWIDGQHQGVITVNRRFPKKMGTVINYVWETVGVAEISCTKDLLSFVYNYTRKEVKINHDNYVKNISVDEHFGYIGESWERVKNMFSKAWESPITKAIAITAISQSIVVGVAMLVEYFCTPLVYKVSKNYWSDRVQPRNFSDFRAESYLPEFEESSVPVLKAFSRNAAIITSIDENDTALSSCIVSGRIVCTVRHFTPLSIDELKRNGILVRIKTNGGKLIYDSIRLKLLYSELRQDLLVFEMERHVPVIFPKIPIVRKSNNTKAYLITPGGVAAVGELTASQFAANYTTVTEFVGSIEKQDYSYPFRLFGLCGSWLVNQDGYLVGHHVAGSGTHGLGISKHFPMSILNKIYSAIEKSYSPQIKMPDIELNNPTHYGDSALSLRVPDKNHIKVSNNIVPSLVHGIFPLLRRPANVNFAGRDSTWLQASKAFEAPVKIRVDILERVKSDLHKLLPTFKRVSKEETYSGFETIGSIPLDTSAGYGFPGLKGDYCKKLENGTWQIDQEVDRQFSILSGDYRGEVPFNFYQDVLKVELRDERKVDNPRAFSACTLPMFLAQKRLLADLVNKMRKTPYRIGCMVGMNVFSQDWDNMFKYLAQKGRKAFDGDEGKFDKRMLAAFQLIVNETLDDLFIGTEQEHEALRFVLQMLITSFHLCGDRAYMATHGNPSGNFLTANLNSIVNYALFLYSYYILAEEENIKVNLPHYIRNVGAVFYGDDSIISMTDEVCSWFNAFTVTKVMNRLGLEFTPANKGEWEAPWKNVEECIFLKRSRYIHRRLGVVASLDSVSMESTLNYVKDQFRNEELTRIKLLNFQREAYLHPNYYEIMQEVSDFVSLKKFSVEFHTEAYLDDLYLTGGYGDLLEMH